MKKILVVFNGAKFAYHVLEQAIAIARQDNSLLVGIFLRPPTSSETIYPFINDLALTGSSYYLQDASVEDAAIIKTNITIFRDTCSGTDVNHSIHLDKGTPVNELLKESVFADLIVIDAMADLYTNIPGLLTPSLRELLADSHCPVLVVHEKAQPVEKAILTYDGSPSSMHAIKMYSYLFPHLRKAPTRLVTVTESKEPALPNAANATNWLKVHFTGLVIDVLNGDTKSALKNYLEDKQANALIVMGAYGRNAVSRLLRQSLANYILSHTTMPLFITHE